jgi:hypothetical protein
MAQPMGHPLPFPGTVDLPAAMIFLFLLLPAPRSPLPALLPC